MPCILVLSCLLPSASTLISAIDASGVLFSASMSAGQSCHMGYSMRGHLAHC